jgi:hypothetical protein
MSDLFDTPLNTPRMLMIAWLIAAWPNHETRRKALFYKHLRHFIVAEKCSSFMLHFSHDIYV